MKINELIDLARQYQNILPEAQIPELPVGCEIAAWIDHTILKPDAKAEQIVNICQEAAKFGFASVCINPVFIPLAVETLKDSSVPVCAVIGFPLGATSTYAKVKEAHWSMNMGAKELDMVIPIGLLKSGQYQEVLFDIKAVSDKVHASGGLIKVIFEMAYLDQFEKILTCLLCKEAGADFVKTSTGFGPSGATLEDVHLMRAVVGDVTQMGVKAAGGIRTYADAINMIKAGANRIGASAGVNIVSESEGHS